MRIEYVHASKFGNGAKVAAEFARHMEARGAEVGVHHVREVEAARMPPADLYVFSSPGRMGRPIRAIRRFLEDLTIAAGTRYALLTTEMAPRPDKRTGRMPTEEDICRFQHVRPWMNEALQRKGLVEVAEEKVYVTDIKGPLENGWEAKVAAFADRMPRISASGVATART
jgi:menaquinone-dependent protoporphyrinogen IX oxidase